MACGRIGPRIFLLVSVLYEKLHNIGMRLSMLHVPLLLLLAGVMSGCTGIPDGIKPVQPFELQRYLGKWYPTFRTSKVLFLHLTQQS